jgi:hypothetical protein
LSVIVNLGGGHPKGATIDSKVAKGDDLIDAKNWCAMEYARAKRHHLTIQKREGSSKRVVRKVDIAG